MILLSYKKKKKKEKERKKEIDVSERVLSLQNSRLSELAFREKKKIKVYNYPSMHAVKNLANL